MSNIRIDRYGAEHKRAWDDFVTNSKNGVFLFQRDYMEYHADRFHDHSLVFYDERDKIVALLPATIQDGVLSSHAGLTFGGLVSDAGMKVGLMLDVFDALTAYLQVQGVRQLDYKAIPHIYHRLPAEEDLYALFRHGARLCRRDVSVSIDLGARLPFSKGRKWAIKQGQKANLEVRRSFDFDTFMSIEAQVLAEKYGARPVHTPAELALLAGHFPDNIKLFAAHRGQAMLAGIIIYESHRVAHTQYIGAGAEGRKIGALDLIVDYLINDYYATKQYFDFGTSTEDGRYLNAGLIENKQLYGARAIVNDFYELELHPETSP